MPVRAFRSGQWVAAAGAAWLVTLIVATAGTIAVSVVRNPSSAAELAFLFPLLMCVPFAFTAVLVLLPLMSLAARVAGSRLWLLVAAGVAAAPLQVLALLAVGRIVFRGGRAMRPTLGADVAAVFGHPSPLTLAALLGLALGGVTMALWYRRTIARSI